MIRRINKLKNVGRFANLRSQSGNQGDFEKFNVIYGRNASGKSTLCDLLRSLSHNKPEYVEGRKRFGSTDPIDAEILLNGAPAPKFLLSDDGWRSEPEGTDIPRILVYDDRFVADNVLIGHSIAVDQRRNLYGLVVGEQGIALRRQVDDAEQALSDATSGLNTARTTLAALIPNGWNIETFRPLPRDENIDQLILEANRELEVARRTRQNAEAIRQRRPLQILNPPEIPIRMIDVLATTLDDIVSTAEGQIREHLLRHSRGLGIDWVRQGQTAQVKTGCPYCGQEMRHLEILQAYRAFFSGEFQRQQQAQQQIIDEIERDFGVGAQERLQQDLTAHVVERDWWRDAGEYHFDLPAIVPVGEVVARMESARTVLIGSIRRKQAQPSVAVIILAEEQAAIDSWTRLSTIVTDYMTGLAPINVRIADRQRMAGTADIAAIENRIIRLNLQKRRHEGDVPSVYVNYDAAVQNKDTREREKTTANTALRQQSERTFEEYGIRINELLDQFQADFRVADPSVSFHGGPPSGELAVEILGTRINTTPEDSRVPSRPSLANTLSGGDRGTLGIAFFLAVVEADPNLANTIVVFDDPFHSQDRSRRRRTIEHIHSVANQSDQCFVLSHELDFAREAARLTGVVVRTFKMDALADHSELEAADLPPLSGFAYSQDYTTLNNYLRDSITDTNQLKSVGRCIRQTLEGYLRYKFPEAWTEADWLGDMIGKIRNAEQGDPLQLAARLVGDLTAINEYSKRFYHSENDGSVSADIDPRELKGYVEQTLRVISC